MAAQISATVTIDVPGVPIDFSGTFTIAINNTEAAVNEVFVIDGQALEMREGTLWIGDHSYGTVTAGDTVEIDLERVTIAGESVAR